MYGGPPLLATGPFLRYWSNVWFLGYSFMFVWPGVAKWRPRNPGLAGVAKAIKLYQEAVIDKIDPKKAFKATDWLTKPEWASVELRTQGAVATSYQCETKWRQQVFVRQMLGQGWQFTELTSVCWCFLDHLIRNYRIHKFLLLFSWSFGQKLRN